MPPQLLQSLRYYLYGQSVRLLTRKRQYELRVLGQFKEQIRTQYELDQAFKCQCNPRDSTPNGRKDGLDSAENGVEDGLEEGKYGLQSRTDVMEEGGDKRHN